MLFFLFFISPSALCAAHIPSIIIYLKIKHERTNPCKININVYELLKEKKKDVLAFCFLFNIIICRWKEMKVKGKKCTLKLKKSHWGIKGGSNLPKMHTTNTKRVFFHIFFLFLFGSLNTFLMYYFPRSVIKKK